MTVRNCTGSLSLVYSVVSFACSFMASAFREKARVGTHNPVLRYIQRIVHGRK